MIILISGQAGNNWFEFPISVFYTQRVPTKSPTYNLARNVIGLR